MTPDETLPPKKTGRVRAAGAYIVEWVKANPKIAGVIVLCIACFIAGAWAF